MSPLMEPVGYSIPTFVESVGYGDATKYSVDSCEWKIVPLMRNDVGSFSGKNQFVLLSLSAVDIQNQICGLRYMANIRFK